MQDVEARVIDVSLHDPELRVAVRLVRDVRLHRPAARNVGHASRFGNELEQSLSRQQKMVTRSSRFLVRQVLLGEQAPNVRRHVTQIQGPDTDADLPELFLDVVDSRPRHVRALDHEPQASLRVGRLLARAGGHEADAQ